MTISNLKKERDRLLEVSSNLKVSLGRLEKKQIIDSLKFSESRPEMAPMTL